MMFYKIVPERDLTLISHELGGWRGLGNPGPFRYEKTKSEERADCFSIYKSSVHTMENAVHIKRFSTRGKANIHLQRICRRPGCAEVK